MVGSGLLNRRALRVQVQLLPPPPSFGGEVERQHWWLSAQLTHRRKNSRTCSSAESERDSAKVEVARSNRARSTKSFLISDFGFAI